MNSAVPRQRLIESIICVALLFAVGAAAYLPDLLELICGLLGDDLPRAVTNRDFVNYWMAGRLLLDGEQGQLFAQQAYFSRLQQLFGADFPIHNWSYPPHFLLLLWPLGLLDYKPALWLFLLTTFAAFALSVVEFRRSYAPDSDRRVLILALGGYALMMVDAVQNGFLTAALLLFGLSWMRRRPLLAALLFSMLTVKPQLGFLLPLLLVLERNWTVFGFTAAFTAFWVGLSAMVFGTGAWRAFFSETVPYQHLVMTQWQGIFLCMMPTVFGGARALGLSPDAAALLQWPFSLAMGGLVCWAMVKETDPLRRVFFMLCGTFLISPYAFNYDMGALVTAAALLTGSQALGGALATTALSVVAGLAPVVLVLGLLGLPLAPLLLAAACLVLVLDSRRQRGA